MAAPDYTPEALARAAGVDPWALAQQVTEARPEAVREIGRSFDGRAAQAAEVGGLARTADFSTEHSYHDNGVPVFDAASSGRQSRLLLSDDGEQIAETGAVLAAVATGLTDAADATRRHLRTITDDVNEVIARRNRFFTEYGRNFGDLLRSRTARLAELTDRPPPAPATTGNDADPLAVAAGAAVNGLASLGNAIAHNPLEALAVVGGGALAAVSAVGVAGSVALDATGVGAVAGVPRGDLSALGVATGVGIAGVAGASLVNDAFGPDRVDVTSDAAVPDEGGAEDAVAELPPAPTEIAGLTGHGHAQSLERDGHGVNDEAMDDAVRNPTRDPVWQENNQTYRYVGKDATVVLNTDGEVVTTWPLRRNGWRTE